MALIELAQRLERLDRVMHIWEGLLDGLEPHGITRVIYLTAAYNRTAAHLLHNVGALYEAWSPGTDPFLDHCCHDYGMTRTGLGHLKYHHYLGPEERGFLQVAADAGFVTGMAVPVRLFGGDRFGGFNFGTPFDDETFATLIQPREAELRTLALLVHRRIEELARPGVDDTGLMQLLSARPPQNVADALSAREREVVLLLGHGMTRKECARICGLSPHTVAEYSKKAYKKLGVRNRIEAAQRVRSGR